MNINPESSDNSLPQSLSWLTRHLGKFLWIGLFLSLIFFINWLWITLFAPGYDAQRNRQTVKMDDGQVVVVDYPKRFLVQEEPSAIYFSISSTDPVSISVSLPTTLPLVIDEVDPPGALQLGNIADGQVVISWPISSSLPTTSSHASASSTSGLISATTTIPVNGQPATVVVMAHNANTEHGGNVPFFSTKFTNASFEIVDAVDSGAVQFEIETTSRANWRLFAEKYSFLAIAPLLIAVLSTIGKLYVDRQQEQRQQAIMELERLKATINKGNVQEQIAEQLLALYMYRTYIAQVDWERVEKLAMLHDGKILLVKDTITFDDFAYWPDTWAGALAAASEQCFYKRSTPNNSIDGSIAKTGVEQDILRMWLRAFPRDLLSAPAEHRIQVAIKHAQLGSLHAHAWPLLPQFRKEYGKHSGGILYLHQMHLFPSLDASTYIEQSHLFSRQSSLFWRGHPLYQDISATIGNFVVCGENGVGRTALALALSQFAEQSLYVLPSYHGRGTSIEDVRVDLVRELLSYVLWRPTRLARLVREEKELLADLVVSVLDKQYLLAKLTVNRQNIKIQAAQPNGQETVNANLRGQNDSTSEEQQWGAQSEQEDRRAQEMQRRQLVSNEQAIVEFRILTNYIKRSKKSTIAIEQWFLGLSHIIDGLGFKRICAALDMTADEWCAWSAEHAPTFLGVSQTKMLTLPFTFIACVSGQIETDTSSSIAIYREFKWSEDDLLGMFRHRMIQHGIPDEQISVYINPDTTRILAKAANANPRYLGKIWQKIENAASPEATMVTEEMVSGAMTS